MAPLEQDLQLVSPIVFADAFRQRKRFYGLKINELRLRLRPRSSNHSSNSSIGIAGLIRSPWNELQSRHDGPVSFSRAYQEEDWVRLLTAADFPRNAVSVEHWLPGRLCGAVEVRSMILKRPVRLRDMKPVAPVAPVARLVTSNHMRDESCHLPRC